jgi:endonuclease/exonuclease/phosphatase (EEP) superfamily protein YafD
VNSTETHKNITETVEDDRPKRKPFRDWHGASKGLLLGVTGLIAARLGHLWIGFDVAAQFAMQSMLLCLAAVLGMASPRYKGLVASIFFALFIAGYSLWPHLVSAGPLNISALNASERQLKVASFNTFSGNHNFEQLIASIKAMDADVVALVEVEEDKKVILDGLRKDYPYQASCDAVYDCQLAIISKHPISDIQYKGSWEGPAFILASLGPSFGNTTIVASHTTRFPHSRAQFTQVNALVKFLGTVPGRMIVMGDFNATPFSRINQTISQGLGFTRLTNLPSWPATHGLPQLSIDHIFVSPDIRALSDEHIGDNAGSDHYPVTMVLGVPQN